MAHIEDVDRPLVQKCVHDLSPPGAITAVYSSSGLQVSPKAVWIFLRSAGAICRFVLEACCVFRNSVTLSVFAAGSVLTVSRNQQDRPRYMRYVVSSWLKFVATSGVFVFQKWTTVTLSPAFARSLFISPTEAGVRTTGSAMILAHSRWTSADFESVYFCRTAEGRPVGYSHLLTGQQSLDRVVSVVDLYELLVLVVVESIPHGNAACDPDQR